MRLGWLRPVHWKSFPAQEVRALLTTRKLVLNKRIDVEMGVAWDSARLRPQNGSHEPEDV
jgi:hypothetical protein